METMGAAYRERSGKSVEVAYLIAVTIGCFHTYANTQLVSESHPYWNT